MAKLETKLEEHCKSNDDNFAEVKADIKDVRDDVKDVKIAIDTWLEKADSRYASKRTEQLFYSTLGAMISIHDRAIQQLLSRLEALEALTK